MTKIRTSKKNAAIGRWIRIAALSGALVAYSASAFAVMQNNAMPSGGHFVFGGENSGITQSGNNMSITQTGQNALINWKEFNIGSIASVDFKGFDGNKSAFNVINYVNGGNMSQIHGAMNAVNGNVYLINPAGVFIGKSASINVGSLHVSNRQITDFSGFDNNTNVNDWVNKHGAMTNAELMNLGHINANHVTFDGDRIVMDMDRIAKADGSGTYKDVNITVKTTNADNVVLGYDGYNEDTKHFNGAAGEEAVKEFGNTDNFTFDGVGKDAQGNDVQVNSIKGYMWIENLEQLQAMNTNLSGNYALHNGIDATETKRPVQGATEGSTDTSFKFEAIGTKDGKVLNNGKGFTGTFDGLANNVEGVDFSIFDLNIYGRDNADNSGNRENLGLFGVTTNATIRNLTFVNGGVSSTSKDVTNMGMVVGSATGGTISNIKTSADVTGTANSSNIGGIVGRAEGTTLDKLHNTGHVQGHENVGGIVGSMTDGVLTESTNIGQVEGLDNLTETDLEKKYSHSIGGLVGSANGATLGGDNGTVGNYLTVKGGYNVGGIVGNAVNTSIKNAINTGDITATGYITEQYKYYSNNHGGNHSDVSRYEVSVDVNVSNVGGIAGTVSGKSELTDVTNDGGNVETAKGNTETEEAYLGGNVGGIVGKVQGTDVNKITITNATNKENLVRGAHNVGGVAGFMENASIDKGINNGGDILGTGAVYTENGKNNFVRELVRGDVNREIFIIGNIGGIAGYMYGDDTFISNSGNRGTVHTQDITDEEIANNAIKDASKAANVGGIVGKINRDTTKTVNQIKNAQAAVSGSYNTGDVRGYTGVGGVIGMMYNGEVTDSYNQGNVRTTRQVGENDNPQLAVNMGGVVGDTTEGTGAKALIYDVYNSGVIGDKNFEFYARHVGGVVGRLSGDVEKSYNTGAIYNGYSVVGGIAGYWTEGTIKNSFNTGNITVINNDEKLASSIGGIVGTADTSGKLSQDALILENAYNLGTLRSFEGKGQNAVGGIIGSFAFYGDEGKGKQVDVENIYTSGNLYAGVKSGNSYILDSNNGNIGAVYGNLNGHEKVLNISAAYYITPENENAFIGFNDKYDGTEHIYTIAFDSRNNLNSYQQGQVSDHFGFSNDNGSTSGNVSDGGTWRIYDNSTPILNAFLPNAEEFFGQTGNMEGIDNIQYGTAYNPLLTIINANKDYIAQNGSLTYDWVNQLKAGKNDSFAVYDSGLTLKNFVIDNGYYGGTLYSDGALNINSDNNDIKMSSASEVYGGSVNINAGSGSVDIYGHIQATGNANNTNDKDAEGNSNNGNVNITGGDIESIGTVTAADGTKGEVHIPGVGNEANHNDHNAFGEVNNPDKDMTDVGDMFGRDITVGQGVKGNINVTATTGDADLLFGVNESGKLTAGGDLNVTGNGANSNIYIDADMDIKGNINLKADGEIVLDISNVGKYDAKNLTGEEKENALKAEMHDFLSSFAKDNQAEDPDKLPSISFAKKDSSKNDNAMITVDMWKENASDHSKGEYDLTKYDKDNNTTFVGALNNAIIKNGDTQLTDNKKEILHLWVSDAGQLKCIQENYKANKNDENGILGYNFALKNNIDANGLENYESIGYADENTNIDVFQGFTGIFNGRNNYIIGLENKYTDANKANDNDYVGVFGIMSGTVKNMGIISSDLQGGSVGAVAGWNRGTIDNVNTFGNRIESKGYIANKVGDVQSDKVGAAGGIAGINSAIIQNANTQDAVIAGVVASEIKDPNTGETIIVTSTAGGVAGYNTGFVQTSTANTAVTSSSGDASGLGGVVGINNHVRDWYEKDENGNNVKIEGAATLDAVESLGIVNGTYNTYKDDGNGNQIVDVTKETQNIGGIAGVNYNGGIINNAYNEAYVYGSNSVGGIVGWNGSQDPNKVSTIENAVNSGPVTGTVQNTGGLVGNMAGGRMEHAINTGVIEGVVNVGGLVGTNGADANITNAKNTGAATITGIKNVGGMAGVNEGDIDADASDLENNGKINGLQYVGGIAGVNKGSIKNTIVNMELNVVDKDYFDKVMQVKSSQEELAKVGITQYENSTKYFGGVAGSNGLADKQDAFISNSTNTGNIIAPDADYVGGITGENWGKLISEGEKVIGNEGKVVGKNHVGGVAGKNNVNLGDDKANMYHIQNSGEVIALAGGAGGVFGENTGNLQYVELTNSGKVYGTSANGEYADTTGTGGVIGVNTGNIDYSSLINTTTGTVTGVKNVGGLIGINTGTVAGGRDGDGHSTGNYYKYQIYNNGTVVGGSATVDNDNNYEVTVPTVKDGSNIGGLIGNNTVDTANNKTGSLTAGYNTGNVDGGKNTGAIAGSNTGKIDQVFSTVGTNITGNNNDGVTDSYYLDKDGKQHLVGESTGSNDIWKEYAGQDEQLLKVFLTNAKVELDNNFKDTYDGKSHNFSVGTTVKTDDKGTFLDIFYDNDTVAGKFYVNDPNGVHSLADYINNGDTLSSLIQGLTGIKDVGKNDILWSTQIDTSSKDGNPNKLGFNFESPEFSLDKAKLNITLDDIWRVYGDKTIHNETTAADNHYGNNNGYGYTIKVDNGDLTTEMITELLKNGALSFTQTDDKALTGKDTGKVTNDVGKYDWSANFVLNGNSANNYEFADNNNSSIIVTQNKSEVKKAKLTLDLNTIFHQYGNVDDFFKDEDLSAKGEQYGYGAVVEGLVNGDAAEFNGKITIDSSKVNDEAINGNKTANVGHDYKWNIKDLTDLLKDTAYNKNYEIDTNVKVDDGTSHVEKAYLNITLNDIFRQYGNVTDFFKDHNLVEKDQGGNYGYKVTLGGFVNGDEVNPENIIKLNKDKVTDTALVDGGTKTNDASCDSWTWTVKDLAGLLTNNKYNDNYEIRLDTPVVVGKSHVEKANLTINLNDVIRQYGNVNDFLKDLALSQTADENGYKVTVSTKDGEKLVNGDTFGEVDYTIDDKAIINVKGDDRTNNAGSYKWNISVTDEKLKNNYNIKVNEGNSYVKKAVLTLNDIIAKIEYGSKNDFEIYKGNLSGIAYKDDDVKLDVKDYEVISGSDYDTNKGNENNDRVTADVGKYENSIRVDGFELSGADKDNYTFDASVGGVGSIEVTPADFSLTLNDISRVYGDTWTDKYSIKDIVRVNGDNYSLDDIIKHLVLGDIVDGSLKDNNTKTQNVGDNYNWNYDNVSIKSGSDFDNGRLAKNYNATVKVTAGKAKVTKADLSVNIGNVTTEYGKAFDEKDYKYTFGDGKDKNVLVNGDTDQILKELFNGNISYTNSADKTGEGNGKVTADAGNYDDAVNFTQDISNSLKNYNVTVNKGDAKVEQAELKVTLNDIIRDYGDIGNKEYGVKDTDKLVNGDENLYTDLLEKGFITENIKDGTLTDDKKHTQNAGTNYKWTADVKANESYDNGRLYNNYKITVIDGTGKVKKVNLYININNAETEYGTAFDESKYGYTIGNGLANGDAAKDIEDLLNGKVEYSNSVDLDGKDGKVTEDKGTYENAIDFANDLSNLLQNYDITTEKGDAIVTAKKITINVDDKTTSTAEKPNYTGSKLEDLLVNGDNKKISSNDYYYSVQDPSVENQSGTYKDIIGIFINGLDFNDVPKDGFWNNYDITVNNGTLTVKDAIPEKDEHQMMRYDYLFDDNPFDQYRERKAEIHFVDGGMEI